MLKLRAVRIAAAVFAPLIYIAFQFLTELLAPLFGAAQLTLRPWLTVISAACAFLVLLGVFRLLKANLFRFTGVAPVRPLSCVSLLALGISLNLFSVIMMLFAPLPESWIREYNNHISRSLYESGFIPGLIATVLVVPFIEEVLFRGITFNVLRRELKLVPAVVLQTVVFAVFHYNPVQIIYVLMSGAALALVYHWNGSLLASILVHAAYNATGFVIGFQRWNELGTTDVIVMFVLCLAGLVFSFRHQYNYRKKE